MSPFIRAHLPEAVLIENLSSELIYQLPDDAVSVGKFEKLFVDLDHSKSMLGISGYGISNTSLEEVLYGVCLCACMLTVLVNSQVFFTKCIFCFLSY